MDKSYDLNLGKWGPYNKEYAGVLNIADEKTGTTFNVEMFPGYLRRSVLASTILVDGGVKPFECNPNRTNYTYRYELEWKDQVYVDVNYNISYDKRVDIKCTFVNNTDIPQSLNINLAASIQPLKEYLGSVYLGHKPIIEPVLIGNTKSVSPLDYVDIKTSQKIAGSGYMLGEGDTKFSTSFSGTALVGNHFNSPNHYAKYEINEEISSFGIRYKADNDLTLTAIIDGEKYQLSLEKTENFKYVGIEIPTTNAKTLTLIPSSAVTIDNICYGENAKQVEYKTIPFEFGAEREISGVKRSVTDQPITAGDKQYLKLYYKQIDKTYIIKWDYPITLIRRFYCDDIGKMLCYKAGDPVNHWWRGVGDGIYDNIVSEPIFLNANEQKSITFTVFEDNDSTPYQDNSENTILDDNKYAFANKLTRSNLFLNTVYPIYSRRGFIRHNTPGKIWNCLYTWDSGLIGVGLASEYFDSALDNLKAYLTPENDKHSPFIMSGSTVPTQVLLYKYLFDKYPSRRAELKEIYPMVRQIYYWYKNLANDNGLKSGILHPWAYNYNSGGWDDYPPQRYIQSATVHKDGYANYQNTTPVITSAFTVLIAKILKEIAIYFDLENEYDGFIEDMSSKVENLLWNDKSGYYSYLVHDENGEPKEFLKHPDGSDYNQGFDGAYPVVAGISNEYRTKRVLQNVKDGLMTKYGISVVDTRASYLSLNDYWNGSVWVPHGWILWNSLLDIGDIEFCDKISKTYLETWSSEVEKTYSLFENFMLINGRGSGFHNFSGLSSPILDFYASYYTNGHVSCGFETLILDKSDSEIKYQTAKDNAYILVCTDKTEFTINGEKVNAINSFANAKYIPIKKGNGTILMK